MTTERATKTTRGRMAWGVASTLLGAALWGFSGTCSQYLLENYVISTLFVTAIRMVASGALFAIAIILGRRTSARELLHDPKALIRILFFGVFGLLASQITYIIAIAYTNAGTATVLQSANIVMVMLYTCLTRWRAPRIPEAIGLVCAVAATVIIATQGDMGTLHLPALGLIWGLGSAVAAAICAIAPQRLYPRYGSFTVIGLGMITGSIASLALWIAAFAFPELDVIASSGNAMGSALLPQLDIVAVGLIAIIVMLGTFAAYFLFLHGMSVVGAVRGSQLGAIEPVSATACSAILTATTFSGYDWIGLALMVATILLVATKGKDKMSRES